MAESVEPASFQAIAGAGAARWDGGGREMLRATGTDRVRFLNGMLTADIAAFGSGAVTYAAQLDRRGHVLADLYVLAEDDALLLDLPPGRGPVVRELIEKHVIADDVEIEDLSGAWSEVAFEGPGARAALGVEVPEPGRFRPGADGVLWVGGGLLTREGVRALGPSPAVAALARDTAVVELDAEAVELLRIQRFVPACGIDVGERNFPAEARLEGAVSYTKGCYIGQEIVARIHSRGAVNRLLVQLRTEAPVRSGDAIRAGGRTAGAITTAASRTPPAGATALGYVRRQWAAPGTELQVGDAEVPARVLGPPLEDG